MNFKLITDNSAIPIPEGSLREKLGESTGSFSSNDENALAKAARSRIESFLGICLLNQVWEVALDNWPYDKNYIKLPKYPIISIDSVKTYSANNTETTVNVDNNFYIDTYSQRLVLNNNLGWPSATRKVNGIIIRFTAGFGTSVSDIPEDLQSGVLQLAVWLYQNRGDTNELNMWETSGALDLISDYRQVRI